MGRSAALATPPPVGDRHDAGVEESDEGADVLGFPRLPEVPENVGLPTADDCGNAQPSAVTGHVALSRQPR
jgi:hypothetical protein